MIHGTIRFPDAQNVFTLHIDEPGRMDDHDLELLQNIPS